MLTKDKKLEFLWTAYMKRGNFTEIEGGVKYVIISQEECDMC